MNLFVGTKLIKARPMTRGEYNIYRGWRLPAGELGSDPGYLVEYLDGGPTTHPKHDGYISWSPKDVFEKAYLPCPADVIDYPPYLQRVGAELAQVRDRLTKLQAFIGTPSWKGLTPESKTLLQCQERIMVEYDAVLAARTKQSLKEATS